MNSRSIISLVALGVAVLILVTACSEQSEPPERKELPASQEPLPASQGSQGRAASKSKDCGLGGPYLFRGGSEKVDNFLKYQKDELSL